MDLILLRHGEAEDAADPADDAKRNLTDAGRKKLQKNLPQLALLLDDQKKLVIWTSPLLRAVQTAEILADSLLSAGCKVPDDLPLLEFIATGDWQALVHATKSLDPEISLILVGHEPHLGRWGERLAGCLLPFKKGAAACFDFDPYSWDPLGNGQAIWKGQGQLQWFIQPKFLKKLRQ